MNKQRILLTDEMTIQQHQQKKLDVDVKLTFDVSTCHYSQGVNIKYHKNRLHVKMTKQVDLH